jgi:N-acetylneuraminic acid mutarotase
MKKISTSQSAFFNFRILIAALFCLVGVAMAMFGTGAFAQTKGSRNNNSTTNQASPGTQTPDVVQMVGPVRLDQDLRKLPYVAPKAEFEERRLMRYPHNGTDQTNAPSGYGTAGLAYVQSLLKSIWRPTPTMPGPLLTFEGQGNTCGCQPSDSEGDVGPSHYVEAVNESIRIFDKNGNPLSGPTSYNSFFSGLTGTPCANANDGDPYVIYDQAADRWLISDFAFPSFPGSSFWQCIGISQTPDPVSGGWFLYALQVDPANPTFLGDYPKFALWNSGGSPAQNAYFLTMNLFSNNTTFNGVRAYALDRASMLAGGPAHAIGFTLSAADVGASYSFVAASFRTGDPAPAGRNEMVLAIDSPATGGIPLTQVHARFFHVDFATPANSVFGLGPTHLPNAEIVVNPFVDAFTNTTSNLVPQQGTSGKLDTLGDKIMTPVVYQNRSGTESLWADGTIILNYPNGPTAVRWYQFDVTGGNFPATAAQQQDWSNANDGLWRWMPSIAVDQSGNTVIGYSTSSTTIFPSIRYAGRLALDPGGNLAQGEAVMFPGVGFHSGVRWGDYTRTEVDPSNGMDFWHINQYAQSGIWHTRIGKFNFVGGGSPTPTPTPTATPTGSPAQCSWSAGPDLPSAGTRFVGVFFSANGKFYAMGGRDASNVEFLHPFEYDPVANTWTTKSASYPDASTNNMGCGVITESGIPYIYCVGGSNFTAQTTTDRTFRYNPVTDTISTVPASWPPGAQNILPGGFSVFNNKFYTLGGFDVNVGGYDGIWEFTPPTTWVQKSAHLPAPRAYIPTATIGNLIYTGGGADATGGTLTDTTDSFVYNPVADTISTITAIPRATSNTRGLTFCNKMYVLGGAFTTPSNEVDIYDPVSNTWSVGTPFALAGRNFAADTDGTNRIWKAGGYASDGTTIIASMEIFNCPVSPCGASPTPTATATATAGASATPTATATATAGASATPTATATATATATPTPTPTPTPTVPPRPTPTPRPRPTPPPRP